MRQPGCGWHLPWPIETVTKVNVASVNSNNFKSRVLTSDVNLVDLHFAVQYQYTDPVKKLFRRARPGQTLSEVSESAIREIVGRSTLDDVLDGARPEITRRTKELIQHTLDYYNSGITVTSVNLQDVQVPEPVIPSQRDANKAQADKERFDPRSRGLRERHLPVAQGGAARVQQDAEAYKAQVTALAEGQAARFTQLEGAYAQAPEVTRQRLYMDTIESVLARAHKVLIDGHAGNMFYLPIDKLLEKMTGTRGRERARGRHRRGHARQGARPGDRRGPRARGALMDYALSARLRRRRPACWRSLRSRCSRSARPSSRSAPSSGRSSAPTTGRACT